MEPTQESIAEELGVSHMTISRILEQNSTDGKMFKDFTDENNAKICTDAKICKEFTDGNNIQNSTGGKMDKDIPTSFLMDSRAIGKVRVEVFKDGGAIIDGVTYSNNEIKTYISQGLKGDDLQAIHEVKRKFKGTIIPQDE